MPDSTCSICCHETRNAIASVAYLAKQVRQANPTHDSHQLDAALARLDRAQRGCAGGEPLAGGAESTKGFW